MGAEQSAHCPRVRAGPGSGPVGSTACTAPCRLPDLATRLSRQRWLTATASVAFQLKEAVAAEVFVWGRLALKTTSGGVVSCTTEVLHEQSPLLFF